MNREEQIAKIREQIAQTIRHGILGKWEDCPDFIKAEWLEKADQLLAIPRLVILDENQELPGNPFYGLKERGYEKAQQDMAGFRRVLDAKE